MLRSDGGLVGDGRHERGGDRVWADSGVYAQLTVDGRVGPEHESVETWRDDVAGHEGEPEAGAGHVDGGRACSVRSEILGWKPAAAHA
jgi:hypothetical protein